MTTCEVGECTREIHGLKLCHKHYMRMRRRGTLVTYHNPTEPYMAILKHGVRRKDECLLYEGPIGSRGYGKIFFKGKHLSAHRVSYEKWHGEIPSDLHVDHICHNEASHRGECAGGPKCLHKRCINPQHLRVITCKDNLNAVAKKLGPRKTHCPHDHEYTEENTHVYYNKRGAMQRSCLTCERARTRRRTLAGAWKRA